MGCGASQPRLIASTPTPNTRPTRKRCACCLEPTRCESCRVSLRCARRLRHCRRDRCHSCNSSIYGGLRQESSRFSRQRYARGLGGGSATPAHPSAPHAIPPHPHRSPTQPHRNSLVRPPPSSTSPQTRSSVSTKTRSLSSGPETASHGGTLTPRHHAPITRRSRPNEPPRLQKKTPQLYPPVRLN